MSPLVARSDEGSTCLFAHAPQCRQPLLSRQRRLSLPSVVYGTPCSGSQHSPAAIHAAARLRCGARRRSWMIAPAMSRQPTPPLAKEPLGFHGETVHKGKAESTTARCDASIAGARKLGQASLCAVSSKWIDREGTLLAPHCFTGYFFSAPWTSSIDEAGNFRNIVDR